MCIILAAINRHPHYKFILAANRDEFYTRPTAHADFWQEAPEILAGKDLVHGGTWLGITKKGRFAAVTNFRQANQPKGKISRGNLVKDFLTDTGKVADYFRYLQQRKNDFSGFNLLFGNLAGNAEIAYFSNRGKEHEALKAGIYGLSNGFLDTPWHKVRRGKMLLKQSLADVSTENLLLLLSDKTLAADQDLPETGIGIERERILSPIFIETAIYGTRCSSILLVGNDEKVSFTEKTYFGNTKSQSDGVYFEFSFARNLPPVQVWQLSHS